MHHFDLETMPVYVRAGAFVPMAKVVQSTRDYSTRSIDLHYYHDASVAKASPSAANASARPKASCVDASPRRS